MRRNFRYTVRQSRPSETVSGFEQPDRENGWQRGWHAAVVLTIVVLSIACGGRPIGYMSASEFSPPRFTSKPERGVQSKPKPSDVVKPTDGAFIFTKRTDPITDRDNSAIVTAGENGTMLILMCGDEGLAATFILGKYFRGGTTSKVYVEHRFPPEKAETASWTVSGNHQVLVMPESLLKLFTEKAKTTASIVLRAQDVDGDTVTGAFKLDGFSSAFAKLPCSQK